MSIDHTKAIYLIKLVEVMRERGCPVEPVLAAARMSDDSLHDHDASIPLSQPVLDFIRIDRRVDQAEGFGFGGGESPSLDGRYHLRSFEPSILCDDIHQPLMNLVHQTVEHLALGQRTR